MSDVSTLKAGDFEPLLHDQFMVHADQGDFEFVLTEVTEQPEHAGVDRVAFSLLFRGPVEPQFTQGTFPLNHEQMGDLPLFMVPVGREEEGVIYQAVFN